ncbi:MAG: RNase P subunit p30 family protein [archaeon]
MYDLHNNLLLTNSECDLRRFGFRKAGVVFADKFEPEKFRALKENSELELFSAVKINSNNPGQMRKAVEKFRNQVDVILVHTKDNATMRAVAESNQVDVIAHAFVDQTSAREAAAHNVALEINLKDILAVYGMKRAVLLSKIRFNLNLARKYKTPMLLTTGASELKDMRSAKQIIALAECIGFTHDEAKRALNEVPAGIIEKSRAQKRGEEIMDGVRRVKR